MRYIKVRKRAKIGNRYNQIPRLTQVTNGKVTNSQLDATNESQEVSPFPAGVQLIYTLMLQDVEAYPDKVNWSVFVRKLLSELVFFL